MTKENTYHIKKHETVQLTPLFYNMFSGTCQTLVLISS